MTGPTDPSGPPRPSRGGPLDGDPTVFAADEQAALPVDTAHLVRLAEQVLEAEGVRGDCELSLYFVDEDAITDLNTRFLGGEGPTDVLAFPIDDDLVEIGRSPDAGTSGPDRTAPEPADVPLLLGDIVICPVVADRNVRERAAGEPGTGNQVAITTYEDELALLVVHGILHVLGMDHVEDDEAAVMQARERELLDAFHRPTG